MKKIIYIHLTSRCELACPSCYGACTPCGKGFIRFEEFKEAVRAYDQWPIEVSLEGGEPFLHPHLFLFMEYLAAMDNVKKIVVCTNGKKAMEKLPLLDQFVQRTHARLDLRFEVLSDIIDGFPELMDVCRQALDYVQGKDLLTVSYHVRWKNEEDRDFLISKFVEYDIPLVLTSFDGLLAYGRLEHSDYPIPSIPDGPATWTCIAWDGTDFHQDLAGRARYEMDREAEEWRTVQHNPVFDSKNHRRMWKLTQLALAGIRFEDRGRMNILEMQRNYINSNQNRWTRQMSGRYDSYAEYYLSLFPEKDDILQNPFDVEDVAARKLTEEFWAAVESARTTMFIEWFQKSISHAISIAMTIEKLPVKIGIPNTEAKSIWLLRGEE